MRNASAEFPVPCRGLWKIHFILILAKKFKVCSLSSLYSLRYRTRASGISGSQNIQKNQNHRSHVNHRLCTPLFFFPFFFLFFLLFFFLFAVLTAPLGCRHSSLPSALFHQQACQPWLRRRPVSNPKCHLQEAHNCMHHVLVESAIVVDLVMISILGLQNALQLARLVNLALLQHTDVFYALHHEVNVKMADLLLASHVNECVALVCEWLGSILRLQSGFVFLPGCVVLFQLRHADASKVSQHALFIFRETGCLNSRNVPVSRLAHREKWCNFTVGHVDEPKVRRPLAWYCLCTQ